MPPGPPAPVLWLWWETFTIRNHSTSLWPHFPPLQPCPPKQWRSQLNGKHQWFITIHSPESRGSQSRASPLFLSSSQVWLLSNCRRPPFSTEEWSHPPLVTESPVTSQVGLPCAAKTAAPATTFCFLLPQSPPSLLSQGLSPLSHGPNSAKPCQQSWLSMAAVGAQAHIKAWMIMLQCSVWLHMCPLPEQISKVILVSLISPDCFLGFSSWILSATYTRRLKKWRGDSNLSTEAAAQPASQNPSMKNRRQVCAWSNPPAHMVTALSVMCILWWPLWTPLVMSAQTQLGIGGEYYYPLHPASRSVISERPWCFC